MKKRIILSATILTLAILGCDSKGPAQKAGEHMDEVVDNVREGKPPLKERTTLEKLDAKIDRAVDNMDSK